MSKNKVVKIYIVVAISLLVIFSLFVLRFYYQGKIGIFADYSNMFHFLSLNTENGDFGTEIAVDHLSMKENIKFFGSCQATSVSPDEDGSYEIRCPNSRISLENPELPGYYATYIKNPQNLDVGAIEVSAVEPEGYTCPTDMVSIKVKYCSEPGESSDINQFCNNSDYVVADSVNPKKLLFEKDRVRNKNILLVVNLKACSKEIVETTD